MDRNDKAFYEKSMQSIKMLFQAYPEQKDFARFLSMFDQENPWFCAGIYEICCKYEQALEECTQLLQRKNFVYEVAMKLCDATLFEYDVLTKQLILPSVAADAYRMPTIIEDGMETMIRKGIIEPVSADGYRSLYEKIHAGEPFAKTMIKARDDDGVVHEYELSLTSELNEAGKPIRAIGVRRNVTEMRRLEKAKDYGETLAAEKHFVCEANITKDLILYMDPTWADGFHGSHFTSFSQMIAAACALTVEPSYRELVMRQLSRTHTETVFAQGQRLFSFIYRKNSGNNAYRWFESTVNIIRDSTTGDLNLRYYTVDINDQKEKEQKALEEQRLYETMTTKSLAAYEINITQDRALSGYEKWGKLFGIQQSDSYTQMTVVLCEQAIYGEDREKFKASFFRENVLNAFQKGERELICEYRRPDESGMFIWVRCSMHLYEDLLTGDIRGYCYVEDIHQQKLTQLALIYKSEHDQLTGLYNKAATEKIIDEFLAASEGKSICHACLIIDIDYFKLVNDNFGHAFGDAVLSQAAGKIRDLFRDDDVVGRIGGDEFVVLMKNISDGKAALAKSSEICAVLSEVYSQNGRDYKISASIGIALYTAHGTSYKELYQHSDAALYVSKRSGRNQFSMYAADMEFVGTEVKGIDAASMLEIKNFEENISEYVFRILYESPDKQAAVTAVLSLIGKHYNVSRCYVFEDSADGRFTSNTFEWNNLHMMPQMDLLQNIAYDELDHYRENFGENGIFYLPDISHKEGKVKEILETQGVKSLVQFAIIRKGKFAGFIGFDECRYCWIPSKRELTELNHIANLLGVFITEMRAIQQLESMRNATLSIVNGLDSYAYVCNPQTHRVQFINTKASVLVPSAQVGDCCYAAFWNRTSPCEVCPMKALRESTEDSYSMEIYNPNLQIFVKTTASWIDWLNGERGCLVNSVDISAYRKKRADTQ